MQRCSKMPSLNGTAQALQTLVTQVLMQHTARTAGSTQSHSNIAVQGRQGHVLDRNLGRLHDSFNA
jgi:hypothetical protein